MYAYTQRAAKLIYRARVNRKLFGKFFVERYGETLENFPERADGIFPWKHKKRKPALRNPIHV